MGFSLGSLLQAALLVLNALAILNERRFLRPLGLGDPNAVATHAAASPATAAAGSTNGAPATSSSNPFSAMDAAEGGGFAFLPPSSPNSGGHPLTSSSSASSSPAIAQFALLLTSVRMLLRWPLIVANLVCIAFTVVFG